MGKLLYHRLLRVVQVKKGVCAAAWGGAVTRDKVEVPHRRLRRW